MELRDRKYIKNRKQLPKFGGEGVNGTGGKVDAGNNWLNIDPTSAITGTLNTAASIYDAHQFTTTSDDYINKYGSTNSNIGGIGYTKYNDIDRGREMDIVGKENTQNTFKTTLAGAGAGAAIGSIVPGVGTAIGAGVGALVGGLGGLVGGLFGGSHRKHKARQEMREALARIDNYNEMNRSNALTTSLLLKQAEKYGDSRSQLLFGAHNGKPEFKDPISQFNLGKKLVHTSDGKQVAEHNSFTELGESIRNRAKDTAHVIDEGPNDTAPSYLENGDHVYGNEVDPISGKKFKDLVRPYAAAKELLNKNRPKGTGWLGQQTQQTWDAATQGVNKWLSQTLDNIADRENMVLSYKQNKNSAPRFKDGLADEYGLTWLGNAVPSSIGTLASLALYFEAKGDKPYRPDTYIANKYLTKGLETLGGLRINPYSTIQQLRDAEARTNYAVGASGGMSTAQKNLARIAALHGTLQQIGNMLNSIQAQNNAYKAAYANAMLQSGETEAQRRQAAKQYDLEYYSKAHAARQQMMLMGMRNFLDYIQQYGRNEFERKNALANIGMYKQSIDIEREKLDRLFPKTKAQDASSTTWTGGIPYVIAPEILDKIPGAITQPTPQFVPGPQNWQKPRNTWADNIMKQYGWGQ